MGLERIGTTIGKEIIAWTKASGSKSLIATSPVKINTIDLKYIADANLDTFATTLTKEIGFTSQKEIIQYFKNIGINIHIEDFSPQHLETFNLIRNDIEILRTLGVKKAIPKEICMSDWRNIEKTKQLCSEYGINIQFPPNRRAYCGNNSSNVMFINSSEEALANSNGIFKKFKHEIGHRNHYTYMENCLLKSNGANSVLGRGVCDNLEFANRQLRLLGIEEQVAAVKGISYPYQLTQPINGILIPLKNGKILKIDTSKMVRYMNEKCKCYNKEYISEQVAEIFEDLLKGRRYDDLTMLMYDFAGGGRIPNLIVNGQKYDNYIESLYKNAELVNKLKEFIAIS